MRPISEPTSRVASKSFERKYIALGRIVNSWASIIGEKLASKAQPVKIRYRKKPKGQAPEAVLEIATSSADATVLHYQKDLILERINHIFGDRWIQDIRFVHVQAPVKKGFRPPTKKKLSLTGDETEKLSGLLDCVVDEEIKLRLNSIGKEILIQER